MPDTIERRYSPLVPPDMTDELFWKDGLDPEDERVWVPGGPGRWSRPLEHKCADLCAPRASDGFDLSMDPRGSAAIGLLLRDKSFRTRSSRKPSLI